MIYESEDGVIFNLDPETGRVRVTITLEEKGDSFYIMNPKETTWTNFKSTCERWAKDNLRGEQYASKRSRI